MSKHPYLLTPQAQKSLRIARQWSRNRWGEDLTRRSFEALHKAACHIAQHCKKHSPESVMPVTGNLGTYPVREHYLIYVPWASGQVAIVDVIRQQRDVPAILAKNAPLISCELKALINDY